tara:strand:+ start:488 stop:859 length:372 start_codon:yes stop_codon:yes gene_type:complete
MTIDDAQPAEWDNLHRSNALGKSYSKMINTAMGDKEDDYEQWVMNRDDPVNHPPHYNKGGIECIDAIKAMLSTDEFVGYLRGNSLKYRWRMRYKSNPIQDMEKAQWYESKLMQFWLENQDDLG